MILLPVALLGVLAATVWQPLGLLQPTPKKTEPVWQSEKGTANYMLGALADIRGDVPTAASAYLRALADAPESMMLRHRVFELSLLNGDTDTALRLARAFPEAQQDTLTRLVQAVALAHAGNLPQARAMLKKTIKQAPDLLQFQLLEAYLETAAGAKPEVLEKRVRKSRTANLMAAWRDYHLARLWLKAGNLAKAKTLLEAAHTAQPQGLMNTILLGQVYAAQGDVSATQVLYQAYKDANPSVSLLVPEAPVSDAVPPLKLLAGGSLDDDMAATLFDFGLLMWGEGAMTPARQMMMMAVGLAPQNIYYRFYTAMLLELGGDLDAAMRMNKPLLAGTMPVGVQLAAQIRMSEMQAKKGDMEMAFATLSGLVKRYPNLSALHRSLAQVAFSKQDFETAITHYTWLEDNLPPNTPAAVRAELLFALGAAYERKGDVETASRKLVASLVVNRNNPQVLNYLGYMWVENDLHLEDAFVMLKQAHLLAPDDGAITDSLGWAYHMRGQDETAKDYLLKAVEQDPSSPEILDHLGDVYAALNQLEDAHRQWQRALDVIDSGAEPPTADFIKTVRKKLR